MAKGSGQGLCPASPQRQHSSHITALDYNHMLSPPPFLIIFHFEIIAE